MSFALDAGYRISLGQRPYTDFAFFAPPLQPALQAAFVALFGFTHTAVQAFVVVPSVLLVLAMYAAVRPALPAWLTLLVAGIAGLALYGPASFPWMDGGAWFWLSLAFAWLLAHLPFEDARAARRAGVVGGIAAALALLVKTNVGVFGSAACLSALLAGAWRWQAAAAFLSSAATTMAILLLPFIDVREMLHQLFVVHGGLGRRLLNSDRLYAVISSTTHPLVLGLGVVSAVVGGAAHVRAHRALYVMLVAVTAAAFFCAWTGSMVLTANIASFGVQAAVLAVLMVRWPPEGRGVRARVRRMARYVLPGVICAGLAIVAIDQTRRLTTWSWRPSNERSDYALATPAFAGWHFPARYGVDVDHAVPYLRAHVAPHETLMVFADMGVIYGLVGREPYRGMPVGTNLLSFPMPGAYPARFKQQFEARPPDWILLHEATEFAYQFDPTQGLERLGVLELVRTRYTEAWRTGDFTLLRRRAPTRPAAR